MTGVPSDKAVREAWQAEHDKQVAALHAAEIDAAGEPANIGTDGQPHFLRMTPKDGVDVSGDEHNPDDFHAVCGTDGEVWPCEQGRKLEDAARAAQGLPPLPEGDQP